VILFHVLFLSEESDSIEFAAKHGADSVITQQYVLQQFADKIGDIREKHFSQLETPQSRTLRSPCNCRVLEC
jgi:hypothetical protein